jgi:outer membrane lipoprotein-sorting protein
VISYRRRIWWSCRAALAAITICAVSGTGCGRVRSARESREVKKLLTKAAAAYAGLNSFSEETTIRALNTRSGERSTRVIETRFSYRQPNLIYYQNEGDRVLVWVSDGKRIVLYRPDTEMYREDAAPANVGAFFRRVPFDVPGVNELALLAGGQWEDVLINLELGEVERVEGVRTRSISGDIASFTGTDEDETEARQTLWIDTKTYLIRRNRVVIQRHDESIRWEETMHRVEANPDLPDERFQWSPPPEAKPVPTGQPPPLQRP